jgi:hypothetical protein
MFMDLSQHLCKGLIGGGTPRDLMDLNLAGMVLLTVFLLGAPVYWEPLE